MMKKIRSKWLIIGCTFLIALPLLYFLSIPNVSKLKKSRPQKTAYMEYREKKAKEKGKQYRITQAWVPFSNISPYLVKAVLIAEDDNFWRHEGFDYEAIKKALERDLKAGKFKFGGSTISQQLARNLYLSPTKSFLRKIREAIITWRMEKSLSKKRILELYLNVVELGEGIYGVEAASRHYFGKTSFELTPQEAARLATILPSPKKYNPTGEQPYVMKRSNLIYEIMIKRGIVPPEYEEVTAQDEIPPSFSNPLTPNEVPKEPPLLKFDENPLQSH